MKRILVVEDEPAVAFALRVDLRTEGYEVTVETDGEAALALARREKFDAILLDVVVPHKDGFEICRELRQSGHKTAIILLTARTMESEKILGLELGADDYITKPFSPRELRARLKAVLRRTGGDTRGVVRFGDAELDLDRCELRMAGSPVDATSLEIKLLTALVENRGKTLSREQLLDLAWGRGVAVSDRVVDNHVVTLRKKIEREPANPRFLVSVRGFGYRFEG
jgi:DNA-binding response OmpR family regulator